MGGLMFNEDWIHFLMTRYEQNIDVDEAVLKEFIYQYKGTQVTDFVMNVNGTVSTYPSKTRENFCDKYMATKENGVSVNYKNTFAKKAYEIFHEKNLDMYKIWISALRQVGIKPWISIRVNDCHGNFMETDLRKSKYVSDHPELWRIRHREANEYFDRTFDFSQEQVQKNFLDYLEESLERYRPDGLELDFTREAFLFCPGYEQKGMDIMNKIMFRVKELADKYGKNMPINILVSGNPDTCIAFGLDVAYWARQKLISSVTLISRWKTINTDYPIALWKRFLGNDILLGGGQQLLVRPSMEAKADIISNVNMAYGQACANLYNGCNFVYLYNYMDLVDTELKEISHPTSIRNKENLKKILKNIGDYKTASQQERSHVLTYEDFIPYWKKNVSRLPILFENNKWESIKIAVGEVGKEEKACLILGFNSKLNPDAIKVFINCEEAEFQGYGGLDENISKLTGHIFHINKKSDVSGYYIIEIKAISGAVLGYAEIAISRNRS